MFRYLAALCASLVITTAALAFTGGEALLLFQGSGTHDGISFNAATGQVTVKTPGLAARRGLLTDFFSVTTGTQSKFMGPGGLLITNAANQPRIEWSSQTVGQNNFTQSASFDNAAWGKNNSTVYANVVTAPDGTVTGDKLVEAATTTTHTTSQQAASNVGANYTFSVYGQPGERSRALLQLKDVSTGTNGAQATIRFDTCAVVNSSGFGTGTLVAATAVSAANGWCRATLSGSMGGTFTATLGTIILADNANNVTYTGDGASGLYLWGAQMEPGTAASVYAGTTATAPVYTNTPVQIKGLLSEVSRTNVGLQSEALGAAEWTATQATVSSDAGTAPDGATTADKIVEDNTLNVHGLRVTTDLTIGANSTNTMSAWFKPAGRTQLYLKLSNTLDGNGVAATCDAATGTATPNNFGTGSGAVATITSFPNGWYRCTVAGAINNAEVLARPRIRTLAAGSESYTGDAASGMFVWGFQFEAGAAFTSSYIPTTTTPVARVADIIIRTLGTEYNSSAGSVVMRGYASPGRDASFGQIPWAIDDGTNNNSIRLVRPTATDTARFTVVLGGAAQATLGFTFTNGAVFKSATAWAANDFAHAFGGSILTTASGSLPPATSLLLGSSAGGGSFMGGNIASFDYYPVRKDNGFLQRNSVP